MIGFIKRMFNAQATAGNLDDPRFWEEAEWYRKTSAGVRVTHSSAMTYSAVWAATRLICGLGGSIPLHLFRRVDLSSRGLRGEGAIRERDNPLDRVLRWRANPEMDAGNFRRLMWQWQVNWGNADAEIVRYENGDVAALYPMDPRITRCERSESGTLRWVYAPPNDKPRYLTQDKVFHLPNIITSDGIVGLGTIQAAREAVGMGISTEKYGANFFGGDGIPRVVISHPGKPLEGAARVAFHEDWQALYGGSSGRKVATVGGDAKVFPISISAEDSQFLETRQHNVEEIARWYGIPPHMLQRMVQVTYANAEILPIDFVKFTLMLYLDVWESAINTQLVREEDSEDVYAKHNVNGLLRGDSKARSEYLKGMVSAGLMTRNEGRVYDEMEPVEGGDTFLVQGATVPLDENGKPESDFAGNSAVEPTSPKNSAKIVAAMSRAIHAQLSRLAKHESQKAIENAKAGGNFIENVDSFYREFSSTLTAAVEPHFEVLAECGKSQLAGAFAVTWCEAGKAALLEAAGSATPATLESTVRVLVDSREWMDRPLKAITELGV